MPSTSINGCSIHYSDIGEGPAVVISAGGRSSMEQISPLIEKLQQQCRVIAWDRPNLGASDVAFEGASDLDMWTDQLTGLLERLGVEAAYLAGASSGARVSLRTSLRYPHRVRGLFLWLISGRIGAEGLAKMYYGNSADLAERDGMEAVARHEFWAQRIVANPANRGRLLSQDSTSFARTLRRWERAMLVDSFMIGASADDLRKITAPTCIVLPGDLRNHTGETSQRVAALIAHAERLDPPGFSEAWQAIIDSKPPGSGYELIPELALLIADFVERTERSIPSRNA